MIVYSYIVFLCLFDFVSVTASDIRTAATMISVFAVNLNCSLVPVYQTSDSLQVYSLKCLCDDVNHGDFPVVFRYEY